MGTRARQVENGDEPSVNSPVTVNVGIPGNRFLNGVLMPNCAAVKGSSASEVTRKRLNPKRAWLTTFGLKTYVSVIEFRS